jgi:hypothetical protein
MIYGPKALGAVMAFIRAQGILTHSVTAYGRTVQVANTRKEMLAATMGRIRMLGSNMWSGMIKGAMSAIGVFGMMQLAAASVYFAYERISAASEKADRETAYHNAKNLVAANRGTIANLTLQRAQLNTEGAPMMMADGSTRKYKMDAVEKARLAQVDAQIAELKKKDAELFKAEQKALAKFDTEFYAEQEEQRITAEIEAQKAELKNISNNTKQITNNINNKINIPVTVDDKGETPLSKMALDEIINTTVRSAFSVQLINVMEGV